MKATAKSKKSESKQMFDKIVRASGDKKKLAKIAKKAKRKAGFVILNAPFKVSNA